MGLRANRRHHVFLPGSLIGLRSMARTGWKRDVSGSDRLSDLGDRF